MQSITVLKFRKEKKLIKTVMQNTIMVCGLDKGQFGAVLNGHENNIIMQNGICFTLFMQNTFLLFSFDFLFLVKCVPDMFWWDSAISRDWSESVLQKSLSLEQTGLQWVETCLSLWGGKNYCELGEVLTMLCKDSSLVWLPAWVTSG